MKYKTIFFLTFFSFHESFSEFLPSLFYQGNENSYSQHFHFPQERYLETFRISQLSLYSRPQIHRFPFSIIWLSTQNTILITFGTLRRPKKRKGKKKKKKKIQHQESQRKRNGLFSFLEQFVVSNDWHWLPSEELTRVGSTTSIETPMRYLCVSFWHVLHRKHLTCLRAKKLAPWTHWSHFLHKYASSAWQYNDARELHSSQAITAHVTGLALGSLGIGSLQNPPW